MIVDIQPEQTFALRQQVLRPHNTIAECEYQGDREPTSFHLGYVKDQELIGIASFYRLGHKLLPDAISYQLRGMAITVPNQSHGYGAALLREGMERCQTQGAQLVWCNARQTALSFYLRLGFQVTSDVFDIPGIGPHFVMHHSFENHFEKFPIESRSASESRSINTIQ